MIVIMRIVQGMATILAIMEATETVVTIMVDTVHRVMIEVFIRLRTISSRATPVASREQVAGMFWREILNPVVCQVEGVIW